jgi:hypothetical protein
MSKAAQGFVPEAYFKYVEGINPRRTPLIGKRTIYGWKLGSVVGVYPYIIHGKITRQHRRTPFGNV